MSHFRDTNEGTFSLSNRFSIETIAIWSALVSSEKVFFDLVFRYSLVDFMSVLLDFRAKGIEFADNLNSRISSWNFVHK